MKRPRGSGSSAISYLSQRADISRRKLRFKRDQQEFEKNHMEVSANAKKQFQEQQSQPLKQKQSHQTLFMVKQQQQQRKALSNIMERIMNE